ncbi:hypothetical protein F0L17_26630 [Streptomyces sp. TRM43335]|uniref:Uncharacterized protein n=1 Tax=Streptomyces taklimakanensis TaxID=2569853 RepID=A0A6G2BJZ9_9ACTN|nr:hypothetical protein [Streptomyces taklimakanensis]MTE22607.1 hypothetical protein [Streptomyces taklimakanensis]
MRHRIPTLAATDACDLCGYWRCRCREIYGSATQAAPTDSDPDMDEALRRVRGGGK